MTRASAAELLPASAGHETDQRVIMNGVSWEQYIALSELFNDRPALHLTYCEGTLEIMTTSPRHEELKKILARLLEMYAFIRGVRLSGFGSATYRRKAKARGLEPDECYYVGAIDGKFPHLAIEVVLTSGGVNKLAVYEGLGVREVWLWRNDRITIHRLEGGIYVAATRSKLIPGIDLQELAKHVLIPDQTDAVKAYAESLKPLKPRRRSRT